MTSKKLKKTFTAAFLSGSILLQNFPALAAASDTTDWLKESPFRQDITTEKSTPTESVPSETETVSPETLSTFQTEAETEAETEIPEESKSSNNTASFLMADNSDTFSQILQEATLTPSYTFDSLNQDFSWKELKTELTRRVNSYSSKWSVYLKDLTTGNVISINERAQDSASLIKLYVMGAVMQEIQNGNLEMNDTTKHLLDEMITVSDNSATNELVRYLNKDHDHKKGMKKVNAFIKAQGFEYTHEYNGLEDTSLWYDAACSFHIHALTAKHPVNPCLFRQNLQCFPDRRIARFDLKGTHCRLIGIIEQCIACQDCHRFPIYNVRCPAASAVLVVIQCREIIVDQ